MPRMSDEKYAFIEDCKNRKHTARSARNTRTHCGKGGKAMLPSDRMTIKELEAMNGAVEIYNIGSPMTWKEFKQLPDDLKREYIIGLRKKFEVPNTVLADYMGISVGRFSNQMCNLGLRVGKSQSNISTKWNRLDEFDDWWRGVDPTLMEPGEYIEENTESIEIAANTESQEPSDTMLMVPKSGTLDFDGDVDDILRAVRAIIGDKKVSMTVYWTLKDEEDV